VRSGAGTCALAGGFPLPALRPGVLSVGARKTIQCNARREQPSLIAGTRLHNTNLALKVWFLAMDLIG
jgi:hypothetical protein